MGQQPDSTISNGDAENASTQASPPRKPANCGDAATRLIDAWAQGMKTWANVLLADDNSTPEQDFAAMRNSYKDVLRAWEDAFGMFRGGGDPPGNAPAQRPAVRERIRLSTIAGTPMDLKRYVRVPDNCRYPVSLSVSGIPNLTVAPPQITADGTAGVRFILPAAGQVQGQVSGTLILTDSSLPPVRTELGDVDLEIL